MRPVRRWLLVAAFVVAGVWIHEVPGSAARLLGLLDRLDDAPAVASVGGDETPPRQGEPARGQASQAGAAAAPSSDGPLVQQLPTDDLSGSQIMRLLENEIASDTDPAAADEFLRAFGESLDSPE